jgi:hypothetical protein
LLEIFSIKIKSLFDSRSFTFTYVVFDAATKDAVVIDPVLDYEPVGSRLWTESVDVVIKFIKDNALKLLFQSVQVNIDAGSMPDVEGDKQYLKIPVNIFRPEPRGELELNDV